MKSRRAISVHGTGQLRDQKLLLVPGKNLHTGCSDFEARFGPPTALEEDLLCLAAGVYAADIAVLRGEREAFTREMKIAIPVTNTLAFERVRPALEYTLCLLSGDNWELRFEYYAGTPEERREWRESVGTTILFSGGLDSLAYAVEAVKDAEPLVLVSHDSGNPITRRSQRTLAEYVSRLGQATVEHLTFRVGGRNHPELRYPQEHEPTQRVRSFLFVILGALVARRIGYRRIVVMAENGQMAIHLPLTAARIGAFSTHTADPEVLAELSEILSSLLQVDLEVRNPYLYRTKAEIVRELCQSHRDIIRSSVSCWRASRVPSPLSHCGECIPCLMRRIALEYNGVRTDDWARDLLAENVSDLPSDDDGKRNLIDLIEFVTTVTESVSNDELCRKFPELQSLYFDEAKAAYMYRRFAREAAVVLGRYAAVRQVMSSANFPSGPRKSTK